jgi:polysaccharide chain length determinant protein (PEP-CTERM system associated)
MSATPDDRTDGSLGFESLLELWQRRKWVAIVVFVVSASAPIALAACLPDLYQATATILVETQQVSEELVRPSVTSELGARIQRVRQEVMSRSRLADLITRLNLYADRRKKGAPFDDIIEDMRRDVHLELTGVDAQTGGRGPTIAFAISYSGRDPETVALVTNTIADLYVEEHGKLRAGQAARTAEFLKAQLADIKRELDRQEERTSEFKLKHLGELPQQIEANLGSLDRLSTQLRLNTESQIRALDRRDRLESELATAESTAPATPRSLSPRDAQLDKLRTELTLLRQTYSDKHPDVIAARAAIASLEDHAPESRESAESAVSPQQSKARGSQALKDVESELTALRQEEARLRGAILAYEQRVENVPKRQEEFETLSRDYAATKDRHDTLLKRYEEAQLAASLERGQQTEQLRILDPALPPRYPAAPARLRLIAAGLIFSLVLAIGALFAAEQLDTSFHSVEDLQKTICGPVVFSIPLIQTSCGTRRYWQRAVLTAAAVVVALGVLIAGVRHVAAGNERVVRLVARGQL